MATLTPEELAARRAFLANLREVRGTGVLTIRHEGRMVTYQSGKDLDAAIVRLENEIAGSVIGPRRRMFRLHQSGTGL